VLSDLVPSVNVAVFRERKAGLGVFDEFYVYRQENVTCTQEVFRIGFIQFNKVLTNKEHDNRRSFQLSVWLVLRWCFRKLQIAEF